MSPRTLERHNKWSRVLGLELVRDITGTMPDSSKLRMILNWGTPTVLNPLNASPRV